MNFICNLLIIFLFTISTTYAENKPLNIAIERFIPPYVMQGANNHSYGFDIEMMHSLCKIMKRSCQFQAMEFDALIPAVVDKKADLAVSFITITSERAKLVNFSTPYLLSYSRFLTKHSVEEQMNPFNL